MLKFIDFNQDGYTISEHKHYIQNIRPQREKKNNIFAFTNRFFIDRQSYKRVLAFQIINDHVSTNILKLSRMKAFLRYRSPTVTYNISLFKLHILI